MFVLVTYKVSKCSYFLLKSFVENGNIELKVNMNKYTH